MDLLPVEVLVLKGTEKIKSFHSPFVFFSTVQLFGFCEDLILLIVGFSSRVTTDSILECAWYFRALNYKLK